MAIRLQHLRNLLGSLMGRVVESLTEDLSQSTNVPGGEQPAAGGSSQPAAAGLDTVGLKPPSVIPREITTADQVNEALRILGWIDGQVGPATSQLNEAIAELKTAVEQHLHCEHEGQRVSLYKLRDDLSAAVSKYVLDNRSTLFTKGKSRSWPWGSVSTKTSAGVLHGDTKAALDRIDADGSATKLLYEALDSLGIRPLLKLKLEFNTAGVIAAIKAKTVSKTDIEPFGLEFDTPETVQLKPIQG